VLTKVLENTRWLAVAQFLRIGFQLASLTILARLISPEAYGIAALGVSINALAMLLKDAGVVSAVVQKNDLSQEDKNAAFYISLASGIVLFSALYLCSGLAAQAMDQSRLQPLVQVLALAVLLSAINSVPQGLLERKNRFSDLAAIEVVSNGFALSMAIFLATRGWEEMSLAVQQVTYAGLVAALTFWRARWAPGIKTTAEKLKSLASYSSGLIGFNLVNYLSRNADSFVITRAFGAVALGYYSLAYKLMFFPVSAVSTVVARASLPEMSKAANAGAKIWDTYANSLRLVALLTFPVMLGLIATSEQLVAIVFGKAWLQASDILEILALAGIVQSITSTTGAIFMAKAETKRLFKLGLVSAFLQVSAFMVGAAFDLKVLCMLYVFANVINLPICVYYSSKSLGVTLWDYMGTLVPSAVSTIGMFTAVCLLEHYVKPRYSDVTVLISCVLTGVLVYAGTLFTFFPVEWGLIKKLVRRPHD
jgi:O-antigen/teichoic acid export membrane protein